MHWFWRWAIAVAVGIATHTVVMLMVYRTFPIPGLALWYIQLSIAVFSYTVPVVVFGLLTRWTARPQRDGETHCRRCDYILRGIPEPRCPECGERV